jgi:hypothetical protein
VDQAAADPAVAVDERVDRLDLSVRDRRLCHRREVLACEDCCEVVEKRRPSAGAGGTNAAPSGLSSHGGTECPGLIDRCLVVDVGHRGPSSHPLDRTRPRI